MPINGTWASAGIIAAPMEVEAVTTFSDDTVVFGGVCADTGAGCVLIYKRNPNIAIEALAASGNASWILEGTLSGSYITSPPAKRNQLDVGFGQSILFASDTTLLVGSAFDRAWSNLYEPLDCGRIYTFTRPSADSSAWTADNVYSTAGCEEGSSSCLFFFPLYIL